jgi:FtsP/CotA-like multicopper oxidase with cupredoxin domain
MPRRLTRRSVLKNMGAAVPLIAAPQLVLATSALDGFTVLRAAPGTAPIMGGEKPQTSVWAYDGGVPGPILRVTQGNEIRIRFENRLPQPSTVHWHGIRNINAMDGVAYLTQDPVLQGASFDYVFTPPDAGTFWYHPHARTWEQLARGLYGLLIVEEKIPLAFDADIPLVLDDWRIDDDGALDEASFGHMMDWSHGGRLGNWLTVNGTSRPTLELPAGGRVRLRLVNTSNARTLNISLTGLAGKLIALDGQPVPPEDVGLEPLVIAPAQRVDLAIDVAKTIGTISALDAHAGAEKLNIANFTTIEPLVALKKGSIDLPENPLARNLDLEDPLKVDLLMEGGAMGGMREAIYNGLKMNARELMNAKKFWAFNGIVGRAEAAFFSAKRGQTVVVNMINQTAWPHAMHFHGTHFKVIEKNGEPVANAPWRDTELMQPEDTTKISFKADNPGKWMVHCHMLEHQAAGMAAWFEVI